MLIWYSNIMNDVIGMGVCTADGFASQVNVISSGLPVITCNGWWENTRLKVFP